MCIHVHGFSDAAFLELLRNHRPTAIFAADGKLALRMLHFCSFYRIPVPRAFSIAAFHHYDNDFQSPLSITGTEQESILKRTEESVLACFEGKGSAGSASFAGSIVPAESTAPPSGDDSWLKNLPETFEHDRKWFPDNQPFERKDTQNEESRS